MADAAAATSTGAAGGAAAAARAGCVSDRHQTLREQASCMRQGKGFLVVHPPAELDLSSSASSSSSSPSSPADEAHRARACGARANPGLHIPPNTLIKAGLIVDWIQCDECGKWVLARGACLSWRDLTNGPYTCGCSKSPATADPPPAPPPPQGCPDHPEAAAAESTKLKNTPRAEPDNRGAGRVLSPTSDCFLRRSRFENSKLGPGQQVDVSATPRTNDPIVVPRHHAIKLAAQLLATHASPRSAVTVHTAARILQRAHATATPSSVNCSHDLLHLPLVEMHGRLRMRRISRAHRYAGVGVAAHRRVPMEFFMARLALQRLRAEAAKAPDTAGAATPVARSAAAANPGDPVSSSSSRVSTRKRKLRRLTADDDDGVDNGGGGVRPGRKTSMAAAAADDDGDDDGDADGHDGGGGGGDDDDDDDVMWMPELESETPPPRAKRRRTDNARPAPMHHLVAGICVDCSRPQLVQTPRGRAAAAGHSAAPGPKAHHEKYKKI